MISNAVENVFEHQQFVHPETLLEVEEFYQNETQQTLLNHFDKLQEKTVTKETLHTTHDDEKVENLHQLHTKEKERVVEGKSAIYETINEELKQQMQTFENIQTMNVYENNESSNVILQSQQDQNLTQEEYILRQQKILEQRNELIHKDTNTVVMNEVERVFEQQQFVHPETLLEVE